MWNLKVDYEGVGVNLSRMFSHKNRCYTHVGSRSQVGRNPLTKKHTHTHTKKGALACTIPWNRLERERTAEKRKKKPEKFSKRGSFTFL